MISNLNGQYDLHKLSNIQFGAIPRHSRGVIRGDSLKSNFPPELTCTLNTNTNTAPCVFLSIPAELQLCMGCGQADQGLPCGRRASPWMSSDCPTVRLRGSGGKTGSMERPRLRTGFRPRAANWPKATSSKKLLATNRYK